MYRKLSICLAALTASASLASAGSISGTIEAKGLRSDAFALVYVEKIPGQEFTAPKDPVIFNQKGKEFVPRVLPVLVGTTVDFLNSDPFAHNVFSPDDCADKFDLGSWATGETRSFTFTKPCTAVVLCNVHPEMVGYVVAVETPYFGVSGSDGSYTISEIPDGEYTVSVWHERFKKLQSAKVTVKGPTQADFTLQR